MTTNYLGRDAPATDWLPRQPPRAVAVPMLVLGHSDEHLAELADKVARRSIDAGYEQGLRDGRHDGRTLAFLGGWLVGGLIPLLCGVLS